MTLKIIESVSEMQREADFFRMAGGTISFVPTMGFLHEGHLKLMKIAKSLSDKVIISIFVNPTQFGPNEDYDQYPRDKEGDLKKAAQAEVDIVFMPTINGMYPDRYQTKVQVAEVTQHLCGKSRAGHFDGVCTVVAKLFNSTKPHIAVFGKKDYQQLAVIRQMVTDLNLDIQIIGAETVREADGLAMSSRNKYLNIEERQSALCLKKGLDLAKQVFRDGEREGSVFLHALEGLIKAHSFTEIDYITICDPLTLEKIDILGDKNVLALSIKVGETRLIDNCLLKV